MTNTQDIRTLGQPGEHLPKPRVHHDVSETQVLVGRGDLEVLLDGLRWLIESERVAVRKLDDMNGTQEDLMAQLHWIRIDRGEDLIDRVETSLEEGSYGAGRPAVA